MLYRRMSYHNRYIVNMEASHKRVSALFCTLSIFCFMLFFTIFSSRLSLFLLSFALKFSLGGSLRVLLSQVVCPPLTENEESGEQENKRTK